MPLVELSRALVAVSQTPGGVTPRPWPRCHTPLALSRVPACVIPRSWWRYPARPWRYHAPKDALSCPQAVLSRPQGASSRSAPYAAAEGEAAVIRMAWHGVSFGNACHNQMLKTTAPTFGKCARHVVNVRIAKMKWTHWDLNPGPSACEADVIPLHHEPTCKDHPDHG